MSGIGKLLGSYKGVAFIISLGIVGALVATGKVTSEQYVDYSKWLFGFLASARAVEKGAEHIGNGKVAPVNHAATKKG